jgi:anti-sigma B factor antagonist
MRNVIEGPGITKFSIESRPRRDRVVVAVTGELDLATVGRVEQEISELYARGFDAVVLDLRALTFIDSTGLRLLVRLDALSRDGDGSRRFGILDGTGPARRLLALTRMDERFSAARAFAADGVRAP